MQNIRNRIVRYYRWNYIRCQRPRFNRRASQAKHALFCLIVLCSQPWLDSRRPRVAARVLPRRWQDSWSTASLAGRFSDSISIKTAPKAYSARLRRWATATSGRVETFDQKTGKILKVVTKTETQDDFVTLGVVGHERRAGRARARSQLSSRQAHVSHAESSRFKSIHRPLDTADRIGAPHHANRGEPQPGRSERRRIRLRQQRAIHPLGVQLQRCGQHVWSSGQDHGLE